LEAASLDPQHRLALEVSWEAIENAGCNPAALAGTPTGVFLAMSNCDYGRMVFSKIEAIDAYSSTGNIFSVAAGRISYTLGLTGPCLAVDTACSGSLVALHLAAQSLRLGECRLALAGGVNLILSPEVNINFSKSRMMASDGKCKTFDAAADGYVRGEGCGVVVLKRLSDALADGDPIRALIRGSALNQDGRSGGLTVPNGQAQQAVIRQALASGGVRPEEIDYVEAHGTGTSLGDPIEAHALAATLGEGRNAEHPLVIGSVKTNLGHLESASGVAGLIKVVLSLEHEEIPRHLHFQRLNPHIDWGGVAVEIPVEGRGWKRGERKRLAGVSSFGFSGTNAHVIVEEAPARAARGAGVERPLHILTVSARSAEALRELRQCYGEQLGKRPEEVGDFCFTAGAGRAHFGHRVAVIGASAEELQGKLKAAEETVVSARDGLRPVFLFSGQGSQYAGMGKQLYETNKVFREAIEECEEGLSKEMEVGLRELLWGSKSEELEQTRNTQPALFAIEYALAKMWRSWGVEPGAVLGHSIGEYVAACVAGVYSLQEGLRLVAVRGRLMQAVSGRGGMAAVGAGEEQVRAALRGLEGRVAVAAENAPDSVVVSGYVEELEEALRRLEREGVWVQRLRVSHGFHSPQMAEMEEEFEREAGAVRYGEPEVLLISSVTGKALGAREMVAGYWRRQVREPVRFRRAMETLGGQGVFLEVGPGSTLVGLGRQCMSEGKLWLASLRAAAGEWTTVLESLAQLYVRGAEIDWAGLDRGYTRQRLPLPTYPFQRQHFWIETNTPATSPDPVPDADWTRTIEAASRQSNQVHVDLDLRSYSQRWECLRKLSTSYIVETLHRCGAFQEPGEGHSLQSLLKKCGFAPAYERLLGRWLNRLSTEGLLQRDGARFFTAQRLRTCDVLELRRQGDEIFSGDRIFLDYVIACGEDLVPILTGKKNALETLFPHGDFSRAEDLYERAPLSVYFSSIARASLEGFLRARRYGAVRVLEIGAGTGSTSSFLIPVLPPEATYHFTDVSQIFVDHAEGKFAAYPFVRYGLLDIERSAAEQGYPNGSFDVVVATNALHATRDIRATISRVRSLLAPGGILLLCEVTNYLPWFDTTTGLIEGWQRFDDDLRDEHPLLASELWSQALKDGGFERVAVFPEPGSPALILGQNVFIAGTSSNNENLSRETPVPAVRHQAGKEARIMPAKGKAEEWFAIPPAQRHEKLVALVQRQIAQMLRFDSLERIDRKRRLIDLGLDSLMTIELRNRLTRALHLDHPLISTLVYDYPTAEAMARYLEREVFGTPQESVEPLLKPGENGSMTARANELEQLDDEEVKLLLLKKLQSL